MYKMLKDIDIKFNTNYAEVNLRNKIANFYIKLIVCFGVFPRS